MNAIQISDVTIHQTESLFSLTDLHRASGGMKKHEPYQWLRNQQTQELIAAIEAQGQQAVQTINGGKNRGTYVCRELVVSYGMWISAVFALQVIQVFLDTQETPSETHLTLNEWEQHQIQVAVKQRSARTGETTQGIYVRLHNFMCVTRYEQIKQADFQAALNFLASIQDTPELFRQPEIQGIVLTEEEIATIAVLTQYAQRMNLFCEDLAPRLRAIQSPMAAEAYSWREMPRGWICKSQRALMRAFPHMQQTQHIDTVRIAFSKMS